MTGMADLLLLSLRTVIDVYRRTVSQHLVLSMVLGSAGAGG